MAEVAIALGLVLLVAALLPAPALAPGAYTLTDQKCADIAFLRSSPLAAAQCGYGAAGIAPADLIRGVLSGTCEPPLQPIDAAIGGAGAAAAVVSSASPPAGPPSPPPLVSDAECAFGGGKLGALLALTRCTARIDRGSFRSYAHWRKETAGATGFNVSSRYGIYTPACAFLGSPTDDGLGGFKVHDDNGDEVAMYCGFRTDASMLPYRMASDFHCEDPLFHPTTTAGVSQLGGIADVVKGAMCDEPNCLRCVRHYGACLAESQAVARGEAPATASASVAASLISHRSIGIGLAVGALARGMQPVAAHLAEVQRPASRTQQLRSHLVLSIAMMTCFTIAALYALNADAIGRLGQYTDGADQVYTILVFYATTDILTLWTLPLRHAIRRQRLARASRTQAELNAAYAPPPFPFAPSLAGTLYLLLMAALFSTPLPLVLAIVAFTLCLRYVTERIYFLAVYAKPPRYDAKLVEAFVNLLPLVLLGKLASAFYFYSNTQGGPNGPTALAAVLFIWLIWRTPSMLGGAAQQPGAKPPPTSPLFWHEEAEAVVNERNSAVGAIVTHQALRMRGEMVPYDAAAEAMLLSMDDGSAMAHQSDSHAQAAAASAAVAHAAAGGHALVQLERGEEKGGLLQRYMPCRWINQQPLPLVTLCPNSYEPVHPMPFDRATAHESSRGRCMWSRSVRLGGAETFKTFDTWKEAREWIETHLRVPLAAPVDATSAGAPLAVSKIDSPLGVCADEDDFSAPAVSRDTRGHVSRRQRFNYVGLPTTLLPPSRSWQMLEPLEKTRSNGGGGRRSQPSSQPWVVCYTTDRQDYPSLKWRLLEANTREALQLKLDHFLKGKGSKGSDVWCVQSVAAEVMTAADGVDEQASGRAADVDGRPENVDGRADDGRSLDERLAGVAPASKVPPKRTGTWVRWVAVLRAGGVPPYDTEGKPTNAADACEWVLQQTMEGVMQRRLADGFELTLAAGTPPIANARLLVFSRYVSSWGGHMVSTTPLFPAMWLADRLRRGMIVHTVAYCAEAWTVVVAPGAGVDGVDDDEQRMKQAIICEPRWPPPPSSQRGGRFKALLAAGYRITTLACGPHVPLLCPPPPVDARPASTYVCVLSKCPNTMVPRAHQGKGSLTYDGRWEHLHEERCWHRDWTKVGTAEGIAANADEPVAVGCCVHASHTDANATPPRGVAPRAHSVVDGDEGTFWRGGVHRRNARSASGKGGKGGKNAKGSSTATKGDGDEDGAESVVTLTLDLGQPRSIDRIVTFWGAEQIEPMPRVAQLLLAPEGAETFRASHKEEQVSEAGMRGGRFVLDTSGSGAETIEVGSESFTDSTMFTPIVPSPIASAPAFADADEMGGTGQSNEGLDVRAALEAADRAIARADAASEKQVADGEATKALATLDEAEHARANRRAGGYVEGVSRRTIVFADRARVARWIQLRMVKPAAGATMFALRNLLVLGPSTTDAAAADAHTSADELARSSIRTFCSRAKEVRAMDTDDDDGPTADEKRAQMERSLMGRAIQVRREHNMRAAASGPAGRLGLIDASPPASPPGSDCEWRRNLHVKRGRTWAWDWPIRSALRSVWLWARDG